ADRVFVGVEMAIGAGRCCGVGAAIALDGGRNRVGGALQRSHGKIARMGIADGFPGNRAQAETLILIEGTGLEAAIVENERLSFAIFDEEFAIIAALEASGDEAFDIVTSGIETVDQAFHKNKSCSMGLLQDV